MIKQPDYSSWLRKPYWRLDEAVALMLGTDPRQRPEKYGNQKQYDEYNEMLETATRSEGIDLQTLTSTSHHPMVELFGTNYAKVDPATFVQWANTKDYCVPGELSHLLDEPEQQQQRGEKEGLVPINKPKRKDDWFDAICEAVKVFEAANERTPSQSELWQALVTNPPASYGIEYDREKKQLNMPGGNPMDRENFSKRYGRYYPNRPH